MSKKDFNDNNSVDEFDISDIYILISTIVKFYWVVVLCFCLTIVFSIYYLKNTKLQYTTSLSIIPIEKSLSTQNSNKDSSFASIIGFSLPNFSSSNNEFFLYKELLKSKTLAFEISNDLEFMKRFYPGRWDNVNKKWIEGQLSIKRKIINRIKNFIGLPIVINNIPSYQTLYEYINDKVTIESNKSSNITLISIDSSRPEISSLLLQKLHQKSDQILKERSIKRTDAHIKFLNNRLTKTFQFDQKQSLIIALADEQKKRMMASSSLPYAAEPFDGKPQTDIYPSKPKAKILLLQNSIISIIVGCFLPIIIIFFKSFYRKLKKY